MIKTIRGKITIGFIATTLITFIIVNLIIWQVFQEEMKNYIKDDMEGAKSVAVEQISNKFEFIDGKVESGDNKLWRVLDNINTKYGMYISFDYDEIKNIEFLGNLIDDVERRNILIDSNKKSSLLYISNNIKNEIFFATFSYPVYIENNYVGTLILQKDYLSQYKDNIRLMIKIISVQLILFLILIFVIYIFLKKSTAPLNKLSKAMVNIGEGNFDETLKVKGKDEISKLVYHFNIMQDKILEQMNQLYLENEKIQRLEQDSREFMNYATHEMKTPLTAILGYSELLQKGTLKAEDAERACSRITTEGYRLKSMVEKMLVIARERATENKRVEEFNITKLIRELVGEYNLIFERDGILFKVKGEELFVYGGKDEFRTVLTNLLDNCVKYSMDGNGYIDVIEKDRLITIRNKIGKVPQAVESKLFEPFIKHNYGDNTKVSSGLGLFICKELVESNGGEVDYIIEADTITFFIKI